VIKLLQALETKLLTIAEIDKVRPISKVDELKEFNQYAVAYEIVDDSLYKNRKGRYITPLFINTYSNVENGEIAVLWLNKQIKQLLDEVDLSNTNLKTYKVKIQSSSPQPEKNRLLDCWQSVVGVEVRWQEL
jgi:hypothetical protein